MEDWAKKKIVTTVATVPPSTIAIVRNFFKKMPHQNSRQINSEKSGMSSIKILQRHCSDIATFYIVNRQNLKPYCIYINSRVVNINMFKNDKNMLWTSSKKHLTFSYLQDGHEKSNIWSV